MMTCSMEELDSAHRAAEALGRAGRWQEARSMLLPLRADILAHPPAGYLLAFTHIALHDLEPALELTLRCLAAARESGDREWEMKSANLLGIISFETGDLDAAERSFSEALALAESCGADRLVGMVANNLGNISGLRGQLERAIGYYEAALAVHRRAEDRFPEAQVLNNLGIAHRDLSSWETAEEYFVEAAAAADECNDPRLFASAVAGRADLRIRRGRLDEAERMARAALLRFDVQSDTSGLAEVYKILGIVAREREELTTARRHLDMALEYCGLHENPLITAEIRLERGLLLRWAGDEMAAGEDFGAAAALFERMHASRQADLARAHLEGRAC